MELEYQVSIKTPSYVYLKYHDSGPCAEIMDPRPSIDTGPLGPSFPVGPDSNGNIVVTSSFGFRSDAPRGGSNPHTGTDFRNPKGGAVYSTQNGVVSFAGAKDRGGNSIVIKNDDGSKSGYAHTGPDKDIKAGTQVENGQKIGVSDSSGTGSPHTHYTYTDPQGNRTDPMTTQFKDRSDSCKKGTQGCL